jgi:hypothetical protein
MLNRQKTEKHITFALSFDVQSFKEKGKKE